MTTLLTRFPGAAPSMGRLRGHVRFVREFNGRLAECGEVELAFRDEMAQLNGELLLLTNTEDEAERRELESGIWDHIAGLHTVFGKSSRLDDLMILLLVTREARLEGELPVLPLGELTECTQRMAFEEHTPALRLELSQKLRKAGVDMNRGF